MLPILVAVTVGAQSVPVGTRVTSSHTTTFEVTIEAASVGRSVQLGKHHEQRSDVHVRAIGADGPTSIELGWAHNHMNDHGPEGSRSFDLPVVGQRYLVDRAKGTVSRLGGGGSVEEMGIARSASDVFGLLAQLRQMLGTEPLEVGDEVPAGPMFAGLLRDAPGTPVSEGTLTVVSIDEAAMTLALRVRIRSDGELRTGVWAEVTAELQGEVVVDLATGWTERLDVLGPVKIEGHAASWGWRVPLQGGGTFRSETALQFGH